MIVSRSCSSCFCLCIVVFFFSSRRRHTRLQGDWSSDVCSSDLEGAGRATRADKARAYTIARAEGGEAAAAVEIAALSGDTTERASEKVARIADRLIALLTGLIR